MKKILIIVAVLALLVAAFFALNSYIYHEEQGDGLPQDYKQAMYTLRREPVALTGGMLTYFGNEVVQDIDEDGDDDIVFLVTERQTTGTTRFYAVAALKSIDGYEGSQAVLIGEDIAPQSTEKGTGKIVIINYAVRAPGESVEVAPSIGKSLHLLFDPATREFGELVQGFEGDGPRNPAPTPVGKCYIGGCSSQLCSDTPNMASTCEYTEAYACYRTATCERQTTGECGWTESPELSACLRSAR